METQALAPQQSAAEQAMAFLDWVHAGAEDDGFVCVAYDNPLHAKNRKFRQAFYSWPAQRDRAVEFLFTDAYSPNLAQGSEVWFSPCRFPAREGASKADSPGWRAQRLAESALPTDMVWADLDHAAENLSPEELAEADEWVARKGGAVLRSGSGENRHVYIKLSRRLSHLEIDRLNRQICAKYQGDVSKANASSILRLPGTFNHKTPAGSAVRILVYPDPTLTNDPDELAAELPPPARGEVTPISGDFRECEFDTGSAYGLRTMEGIIRDLRALVGGRNTALFVAGARTGNLVAGGELNGKWSWGQLVECAREIGDGLPLDEETPRRGFEHGLTRPANAPDNRMTDKEQATLERLRRETDEKLQAQKTVQRRAERAARWDGSYDELASREWEGKKLTEKLEDQLLYQIARDFIAGKRADKLLNLSVEEFEQDPFVKGVMVYEMARELGKQKAQTALMPGNTELGRPSRRSDRKTEYDTAAPGLFLQPGWITLFMADYEVGKTMLAYSLAADRLRRAEDVLVIQEDESFDQTWGKIEAFCLTAAEEDRFQPYNQRGWNLVKNPEMLDRLMEEHPAASLLVVDSVARLMNLAGLEESNAGGIQFWNVFDRFVAKYPRVAVLLIDHQGHNGSGHARGATSKSQMSSIVVQVSSKVKFAKDRDGTIEARVHKHRNGESTGHTWRGDVKVRQSDEPFRIEWTDEGVPGSGSGEPGGQTKKPVARDKLESALQRFRGQWVTVARLEKETDLSRTTVQNNIKAVRDVQERLQPGGSNAKEYRLS
jgi:hypothetical protein